MVGSSDRLNGGFEWIFYKSTESSGVESDKLIAANNFMWLKFSTRTGCYGNFATLRQCMGYDWSRLWFFMPFKNIRSHQMCYKSAINYSIKISLPKLDSLKLLSGARDKQ